MHIGKLLRSPRELRFRLLQLVANAAMLALQPRFRRLSCGPRDVRGVIPPVDPAEIDRLAAEILAHRIPLLAGVVETDPEIEWRRDYPNNKSSGLVWFKRIPYLDFERVGDHKNVWELNRHQHLVVLARKGGSECIREIERQIESWLVQNPFLRGMNWASALEVAFRALSWMWIDQLVGSRFEPSFRERFQNGLYQHGLYLQHNLSTYFSPNTHLLGEAVALHALGAVYPNFPRRWKRDGARMVAEQLIAQVQPDGSHFEQSTYYHVYALDMFRLHAQLADDDGLYRDALVKMTEYLAASMGEAGSLPFIGDDDGGRLFHPYGTRSEFGRASVSAVGPSPSQLFANSGIAVISQGALHILADAGPFGAGGAGHSHSDTLSFTMRLGNREILIDPGTYTYVADPKWRDWFRGSSAHNTIRINGLDQAVSAGPFRWESKPDVRVREWFAGLEGVLLDGECCYRGFTHRRRWILELDELRIEDEVSGPSGEHLIERFWHCGESPARLSDREFRIGNVLLTLDSKSEATLGQAWRSRTFGEKRENPVIQESFKTLLPYRGSATFVL
ncbi:MAG: heparinase II/III family protein [Acidobacteriota bacterium]|nr:heparinase II/III family protein [Acidobacteriota bacterium]